MSLHFRRFTAGDHKGPPPLSTPLSPLLMLMGFSQVVAQWMIDIEELKMMQNDITYKIRDFDYELPQELIAQTPVEPRDASRLLVVHRDSGIFEHRHFWDIGESLRPGDLLIA